MLITDLVGVSEMRVVEREKLEAVLAELKLSTSAFVDPATAQKLGKGLAATHILTGAYLVSGPALHIDARARNTRPKAESPCRTRSAACQASAGSAKRVKYWKGAGSAYSHAF